MVFKLGFVGQIWPASTQHMHHQDYKSQNA